MALQRRGDEAPLPFPDFQRHSTLDALPGIAIGIVPAVVLLGAGARLSGGAKTVFVTLGALCLLLPAYYFVPMVRGDLHNRRMRQQWAHSFDSQVRPAQLRVLLQREPHRYTLHVRYYGGFDVGHIAPAVILEDNLMSVLAAVYPPTGAVTRWAAEWAVRVVQH